MKKERIFSDVDRQLRSELDAKANKLGISRAELIEIALNSELERFNVHKENKRLTEAHAQAEQDILYEEQRAAELKAQRDRVTAEKAQLTLEHTDRIKEIAAALGVPDTIGHIKQRIAERNEKCEQLEREKTERTEQRDEFEKLLHAETDAYNKCYARAESLKNERNRFKAQAEEVKSKFDTCEEKLTLLLTRNWWDRLWNKLPWID